MRIAEARTSRDGSSSARMTVAASIASSPSSVHSARTRVRGSSAPLRQLHEQRSDGRAGVPPRSTSSRCAVSRHQPFGCERVSTSCAFDDFTSSMPKPYRAGSSRARRDRSGQTRSTGRAFAEDVVAQIDRQGQPVLDDPAIHVDDVERAVGRVGEKDRPETLVGRGEELAAFVRLARPQRRAVVGQDDAADEVGGRLGDEDVPVQIGRQPIAAIDERGADGREPRQRAVGAIDAGLIGAVGSRVRAHRPDDVQARGLSVGAQPFVAAARAQQIRVAREIGRRHEIHVQRRLVRIAIDAPRIVFASRPTRRVAASGAPRTRRSSAEAAMSD